MKQLTTFLAILAISCGGTQEKPTTTDTTDTVETPTEAQDILLDKFEEVKLQGMRFFPQAMGRPEMWKITPPKKAKLATYRKMAAKNNAAPQVVQVFAALLWNESNMQEEIALQAEADAGVETNDKKKQKLLNNMVKAQQQIPVLRAEAVESLRQLYARVGDQAEEITLQMLSVGEMTVDKEDAALVIYEQLVTRFPESKHIDTYKTWLAYLLLKADRNQEAIKLVTEWDRSNVSTKIAYITDYVVAWTMFRARKLADARDAINSSAMGWKGDMRDALMHEVILINARSGAPLDEVQMLLDNLYGDNGTAKYNTLATLSKAYAFAGHYDLSAQTLELLSAGTVLELDKIPANELTALPYELAWIELRRNDPVKATAAIIKTQKALATCGEACNSFAEAAKEAVHQFATLFHTAYATSMDEKYYAPAKELYDYYLNDMGQRANTDVILGYANRLKDTKENATPKSGKHDSEIVGKFLGVRNEVVTACYEQVLQGEPGLTGSIKLTLSFDDKGVLTGGEADPAPGDSGLAAVDACLLEQVKSWTLPARTIPGNTVVVWKIGYSPKQ